MYLEYELFGLDFLLENSFLALLLSLLENELDFPRLDDDELPQLDEDDPLEEDLEEEEEDLEEDPLDDE